MTEEQKETQQEKQSKPKAKAKNKKMVTVTNKAEITLNVGGVTIKSGEKAEISKERWKVAQRMPRTIRMEKAEQIAVS